MLLKLREASSSSRLRDQRHHVIPVPKTRGTGFNRIRAGTFENVSLVEYPVGDSKSIPCPALMSSVPSSTAPVSTLLSLSLLSLSCSVSLPVLPFPRPCCHWCALAVGDQGPTVRVFFRYVFFLFRRSFLSHPTGQGSARPAHSSPPSAPIPQLRRSLSSLSDRTACPLAALLSGPSVTPRHRSHWSPRRFTVGRPETYGVCLNGMFFYFILKIVYTLPCHRTRILRTPLAFPPPLRLSPIVSLAPSSTVLFPSCPVKLSLI